MKVHIIPLFDTSYWNDVVPGDVVLFGRRRSQHAVTTIGKAPYLADVRGGTPYLCISRRIGVQHPLCRDFYVFYGEGRLSPELLL